MSKLTDIKNLKATQVWTESNEINKMINSIDVDDWSEYNVFDPCMGIGNIIREIRDKRNPKRIIGIEKDPEVFDLVHDDLFYDDGIVLLIGEAETFEHYEPQNKSLVILNPPYQDGNRSVYMEWIDFTLNHIKADKASFIVPSRWMYGIYEAKHHELIKKLYSHISYMELLTGDDIFDQGVNTGEVVIFTVNDWNNPVNLYKSELVNGKLVYMDDNISDILKRIRLKTSDTLYGRLVNYKQGSHIGEMITTNDTILLDKSNGHFKGMNRLDGGPYDYKLVKKGEVFKNNKIQLELEEGTSLVNLNNFLKSNLINYLFSYLAVTKNSNTFLYSLIPDLGKFDNPDLGDYTDNKLYRYFNLFKYKNHINNEMRRFERSKAIAERGGKSPKIKLRSLGIELGEKLTWIKDDNLEFEVVDIDKNKVLYNDEILTISKLAQLIVGVNRPLQGSLFLKYKGERLVTLWNSYLEENWNE